jgi:hypothetical protein
MHATQLGALIERWMCEHGARIICSLQLAAQTLFFRKNGAGKTVGKSIPTVSRSHEEIEGPQHLPPP